MRSNLYLKTQAQLRAECQARLTDSRSDLATPAQYLAGINEALLMWHGRVTLPKLYNLEDAFTSGLYEYALPPHVNPPFDVQIRSHAYVYDGGQQVTVDDNDSNQTWHTVAGYTVEPTANGGWLLRMPASPSSDAGRIIFWGQNGPMPTENMMLAYAVAEEDTRIILQCTDPALMEIPGDIAPNGLIRLREEWISYGDLVSEMYDSSPTITLTHCIRGLLGTRVSHYDPQTDVRWGVAVDDQRLWINLYDYVTFFVHALQIHKGTSEDVSRHEKLVSFYEQKHMNFWRTQGYMSQRKVSRLQTPQSLGALAW